MSAPCVYLIPSLLSNDVQALQSIPASIPAAVKECNVFFVENEKTARRYLKKIWKEIVIDNYEWISISRNEETTIALFLQYLHNGKVIGIISEAGCPGIADPGQLLVRAAQQNGFIVKPLVGPNAIILSLMASGMNGQQFQFHGYLPIENPARKKAIKQIEQTSKQHFSTQIFIETPYRNGALVNDILSVCQPNTLLCIAVDITAASEYIATKTIAAWKKEFTSLQLHKKPAIFLLYAVE
jgi:16S rRNA (cytidine1402-2'-O)-methyltransferase